MGCRLNESGQLGALIDLASRGKPPRGSFVLTKVCTLLTVEQEKLLRYADEVKMGRLKRDAEEHV